MSRFLTLEHWVKRIYREGPVFNDYLRYLENSAVLPESTLRVNQLFSLKRMVNHCYHNVPYYQDMFKSLGITPNDINQISDLEKLPVIDKRIVKENFDRFISKKHRNFLCRKASTSGTTGSPATFLRDFGSINFEHAANWRHWRNAGDFGKRRVSLRGSLIIPSSVKKPPFWKFASGSQELLMSSYHLSWENAKSYIEQIVKFKPKVLYCFPSNGYLLAKFFNNSKVKYKFDAIFTSSESLEPDVRYFIEKQFESKIFDWYGQVERVSAISQCSHGTYHIAEDYSVVELLPAENGAYSEIIGTHLHSFVMPLLRYRTLDYVLPDEKVCACGSCFRGIKKIVGRESNFIITPEGRQISIVTHIAYGIESIIESQFFQNKPGEVVLRVVTNGQFTEKDRRQLIKNTLSFTSPNMKVTLEEVPFIPRGPNGKFKNIVTAMN